jgi:hypothetical protein
MPRKLSLFTRSLSHPGPASSRSAESRTSGIDNAVADIDFDMMSADEDQDEDAELTFGDEVEVGNAA